MSKIYRSRRSSGACTIVLGLAFVAFGAFGILASGLESVCFFGMPILVGTVVGILGGFAVLSIRVMIDERGIIKSNMYRIDFIILWDELESWSVGPVSFPDERADDSFTFQKVAFCVRDRQKPFIVYDSEVWRPGFEQFLKDVRHAAGNKERCHEVQKLGANE
jgi:hypothetical protein